MTGQIHPKTARLHETQLPRITLRLDSGYVIAKCGEAMTVYELIWTSRHGENKRVLTLRECVEVPRQFEGEAYHL